MANIAPVNSHLTLSERWHDFTKNIQTDFPKKVSEIVEKVIAVASAILSTCIDLLLLPVALIYLGITRLAKTQFNPAVLKQDKIPILLLHGAGYNQTEWIIGRQFLKDEQFGSVFSVDYAGQLSNNPKKGIDDYAAGKVRKAILDIQARTGKNEIILIGHSMGGLIAGYYAEEFAAQDNIQVKKIITIGSPWKGSPAIDFVEKFKSLPKKLAQMKIDNAFLKGLAAKALQSEKAGTRAYYNIGSTTDFMVPSPYSNLTEDPTRQLTFSCFGHYGLIIAPKVWWQIRSWISNP